MYLYCMARVIKLPLVCLYSKQDIYILYIRSAIV